MGVWLEEGEEKKLIGPECFLLGPIKMERKLSGRNLIGLRCSFFSFFLFSLYGTLPLALFLLLLFFFFFF